jgi:hypothetical protein
MKRQIFFGALVVLGLFALQTDAYARGGGWSGGGGGHGGNWHGGGYGYGRGYYNGRYYYGRGYYYNGRYFYGPGFGFYGYPWWPWWGGYGFYYPGPYYAYGGYDDPPNSNSTPQFNTTRAVQAALAWRGYYSGRIDGVMGPETRSAIRAFQKQQGLPVTGEVDSATTRALQGSR